MGEEKSKLARFSLVFMSNTDIKIRYVGSCVVVELGGESPFFLPVVITLPRTIKAVRKLTKSEKSRNT